MYALLLALIFSLPFSSIADIPWSLETYYTLKADLTCCPQHSTEADCSDEAGSNCIWFSDPNEPIPAQSGSQCVGRSYAKCKRDKGIDACCAPCCNGCPPAPPGPTQPGGGPPGGNPTPPVCGPSSAGITPQPTTSAPTTKSPTTKSPTTKSPTTKSPTTKSPTTKSPTTKSPTTKAPTTKSPTTKSPTTKSPTTKSPTTKAPTTKSPTTKSPTTKSPTTKSPTTKAPTTKSPTTKSPTTKAPTTKSPTTKSPTTKSPTTKSPTTLAPTTKSPTTKSPTPAPTNPMCEIGENYSFEGYPCQISGDPHTKMVNGDKHDFQGQPTTRNALNQLQNQFYYVARCFGSDVGDMPFQILGTHFHWGTRPVSGIDYLTLELNGEHNLYYLYLSSDQSAQMGAFAKAGITGVSSNYDITMANAPTQITRLPHNVWTIIGARFEVNYKSISSNQANLQIKIDHDLDNNYDATYYIYMKGQMNRETSTVQGFTDTRYRMHYVYMKQASMYKCASCGLCGNYKDPMTGSFAEELEACDGTYITYRPGWNANNIPEAYDLYGWTYEYYYYNNDCSANYDVTDNTNNMGYVDPCSPTIANDVETACIQKVADNQACCDNTIGGTVCDDLLEDCKFDACVIATDNGGTQSDIDSAVALTLGNAIDTACNVPDIGQDVDEGNLAEQEYIGCYKDSGSKNNRAMEHPPEPNVKTFSNRDIASCIDYCDGYKYMGLQYGKECFCSNSYADSTQFGLQTDISKCDQFGDRIDTTNNVALPGCWGGSWTFCMYEITKLAPIKKGKKQEGGHDEYVLSTDIMQEWLQEGNNMIISIITCIIVLLVVATMYYRYQQNNNNKWVKYIPIDDPKV